MKSILDPFNIALKELGVHETPEKSNERILEYDRCTTLKATDQRVAWCSSFMCWCAEQAGFPSTRSAAAISWKDYGIEGSGEIGDIVVLTRTGGNHVAFIAKPYKQGDTLVHLLGGNQSNSVCQEPFLATRIIAIRRFIITPEKLA